MQFNPFFREVKQKNGHFYRFCLISSFARHIRAVSEQTKFVPMKGADCMRTTAETYDALRKEAMPKSDHAKTLLVAFLVGGAICALGQVLLILYKSLGAEERTAGTLMSCSLIVLTAVLTASGVFDRISRHGAAGTGVPISGFANAIVSPAMEHRTEGRILGVGANLFKLAGPVLAYGSTVCALYGVVYYLFLK
jgi:stage V sporulation protein AC